MNHLRTKVSAFAVTAALGLLAALTPSSAQACTKTVYVHYISFGYSDYTTILANKNACWGLEAPKWSGGTSWSVCSRSLSQPSGGTTWAYNEIDNPSQDQAYITACKNNNGGVSGVAYVTPNSGCNTCWSHSGITGVSRYFNECYNSSGVSNYWGSGCITSSARPMWNLQVAQANQEVYNSTWGLCHAVNSGEWIGYYSNGLDTGTHTTSFWKALNDCTTGIYNP